MSNSTKTVTIARSAVTGKFVKPSYAAKHPKTTVVQHVPVKKGS